MTKSEMIKRLYPSAVDSSNYGWQFHMSSWWWWWVDLSHKDRVRIRRLRALGLVLRRHP